MPGATLDPAIRKLQPYHTEMLYRALGVKPITPNWKDLKGLKGWRPTHPTPLWVFHSFPLFIFLSITPSKLAANERIPPTSVFIRPPRDPVGSNQNSFGAVQSVRSVRSVHAVHVDSPCSANGFKKKKSKHKDLISRLSWPLPSLQLPPLLQEFLWWQDQQDQQHKLHHLGLTTGCCIKISTWRPLSTMSCAGPSFWAAACRRGWSVFVVFLMHPHIPHDKLPWAVHGCSIWAGFQTPAVDWKPLSRLVQNWLLFTSCASWKR